MPWQITGGVFTQEVTKVYFLLKRLLNEDVSFEFQNNN